MLILKLGRRRRRWANIKPTQVQSPMVTETHQICACIISVSLGSIFPTLQIHMVDVTHNPLRWSVAQLNGIGSACSLVFHRRSVTHRNLGSSDGNILGLFVHARTHAKHRGYSAPLCNRVNPKGSNFSI